MTDKTFIFDPLVFVNPRFETAEGDFNEEFRAEIALLRKAYPELSAWGNLAIGCAWGDYSQEVYMVSWMHGGHAERDEDFLNFV